MQSFDQYFEKKDRFYQPNWPEIYAFIENNYSDDEQYTLWNKINYIWLNKLKLSLFSDYQVHDSENFITLSAEPKRYTTLFHQFLERSIKKILHTLPDIAKNNSLGKHVVIIFNNIDDYYAYISHFYPKDGHYGLSTGIYINEGYGHFAFPQQELTYAEPIAAHELTHALLNHLHIPRWLNEGLAVTMENLITGFSPLVINNSIMAKHQAFWDEENIQEFWSGEAFFRPDQSQELSYHLAQLLTKSLSENFTALTHFIRHASYIDGGNMALTHHYGMTLHDMISHFLGEGDSDNMWAPKLRPDYQSIQLETNL